MCQGKITLASVLSVSRCDKESDQRITQYGTYKKQKRTDILMFMELSDKQWKERLTDEQYRVLREKGTEAPFKGEYVDFNEKGDYVCAGCGNILFTSDHKFDSHCGWPSFDDIANNDAIMTAQDMSHNMNRTEVICKQCGGHLGHVFPDGPKETTGIRYCINSVALNFKKKE